MLARGRHEGGLARPEDVGEAGEEDLEQAAEVEVLLVHVDDIAQLGGEVGLDLEVWVRRRREGKGERGSGSGRGGRGGLAVCGGERGQDGPSELSLSLSAMVSKLWPSSGEPWPKVPGRAGLEVALPALLELGGPMAGLCELAAAVAELVVESASRLEGWEASCGRVAARARGRLEASVRLARGGRVQPRPASAPLSPSSRSASLCDFARYTLRFSCNRDAQL